MAEEPKPFEWQQQPAILSPPLPTRRRKAADPGLAAPTIDNLPPAPGTAADTNAPRSIGPAVPRSAPAPEPPLVDVDNVDRLGANLARALEHGGYHPVILFGTAFSGKTSLLLSLFSTLMTHPKLDTGVVLCDPILGSGSGVGRQLHEEALRLFEVGTQAFIAGEPTPKTNVSLPFFIPVEVRPAGKPVQRFAFLESNGEWYRPRNKRGQRLGDLERLYPELKAEIETFIATFQGGITFLYLTPYTQRFLDAREDSSDDAEQLKSASLAVNGVLQAYDRARLTNRGDDQHLMLVTKWDAHSRRTLDQAQGIQEDRAELNAFCARNYGQALATLQGLAVRPDQRQLNAYCSGIINEGGRLQPRDSETQQAVTSYPMRLWDVLYRNALVAAGEPPQPLFQPPPRPPALLRALHRLLDFLSGR